MLLNLLLYCHNIDLLKQKHFFNLIVRKHKLTAQSSLYSICSSPR